MSSTHTNHANPAISADHTDKPSQLSPCKRQRLLSKRDWHSLTSSSLMLGGIIALSACQSTSTLPKSNNSSAELIDFSSANLATVQAQGQAFNKSLKADEERYQQLFNQEAFPNSDSQAKRHLISAIRQHLASEHVAVAKANYNMVPFISADSIDAGSTGLLRTILEVYAYREERVSDDSDGVYDYNDGYNDNDRQKQADTVWIEDLEDPDKQYAEYVESAQVDEAVDTAEEVVLVEEEDEVALAVAIARAELAEFKVAYSKDGYDYDQDGYDRDGYDENGYDRSGYDYDGFDEEGYDYYGTDRDGYDRDGESGEGYEEDNRGNSIRERIANSNPKEFLADYEAMQTAKQLKQEAKNQSSSHPFATAKPGAIGLILNMLHKTPEQIAAANVYQYKYLTFNSVSHYLPKQRHFNSVYSYDYIAPTISSSVQLPVAFDFNSSKISVDPAAIMPIVALTNPKNTPLQMTAHTVNFGLPETITSQLPSAVIYDAAINAMQASLAELAPEHFSAVDIGNDSFAKQVGASRAVKVYFGSKQTGEVIGKMLKYMSQSLQQYVDANPTQYPEGALLKTTIDKIQLYNKGYQSADIGALLQLVEAVVPISFNQVNYYYLDRSDKLLAKQQRINIAGDLMGSSTTVVNEIRYDRRSFEQNKLTPLLTQAFGINALPAIDGDAWLAEQRLQTERLDQARYARYDYGYNDAYDRARDATTDTDISAESAEFEGNNATDSER